MHGEQACGAREHRRVAIVSACMHRSVYFGSVIEAGCFLDFQRVHIGSEQHSPTGRGSIQNGDYRGKLLSERDFEIKISEGFNDRTLSVRKRQAHFRIAVDLASQADDFWKKCSCFTEKRFRIICHLY